MIYFIQNTKTKAIKIGYTERDPKKRLKALQTGSSHELDLLLYIEGTQDDEKNLHNFFHHRRLQGEWFIPSLDLVLYFYLWKHEGRILGGSNSGLNTLEEMAQCSGLGESVFEPLREAGEADHVQARIQKYGSIYR